MLIILKSFKLSTSPLTNYPGYGEEEVYNSKGYKASWRNVHVYYFLFKINPSVRLTDVVKWNSV